MGARKEARGSDWPRGGGSLDPETLWEDLLSEQPARIEWAWSRLTLEEQGRSLAHLRTMVEEEGWQPSQRHAAQAALRVLEQISPR